MSRALAKALAWQRKAEQADATWGQPSVRAPLPTDEIPRTFLGWCAWQGVELEPGQRVVALVCFDGYEPCDLDGWERETARAIFGPDVDRVPELARSVVVLPCGARGGKTYIFIAQRLLWGLHTRDLSTMAPGEEAKAIVVAPNPKLRAQSIKFAHGASRAKPELLATLVDQGKRTREVKESFQVMRRDGRDVEFLGAIAGRGGYGGAGRSLSDAALDEVAFFHDETGAVSDVDIFNAVQSRVLPGGQTIVGSTVWAKVGLLWDLYSANWGKPETALVAHAPTRVLRTNKTILDIVTREEQRNPENASREYGAQFLATGGTLFYGDLADTCFVDESFSLIPGDEVRAGGDFGFRSNSSACAATAQRGPVLHTFHVEELRPEPGKPLKPSLTVKTISRSIQGLCAYITADGHYRESIEEHLEEFSLAVADAPADPHEVHVRARTLMREGRCVIHVTGELRKRLAQQFRETKGVPRPGGTMGIVPPRWKTGEHGDIMAAVVLSLWEHSGDVVKKPPPVPGTPEHEAALFEARRQRHLESQQGWKRPGGDRGPWRKS